MIFSTTAVDVFFLYVGFLLGAAASQALTDSCKYAAGRLRPHFFDVCRLDLARVNCTGPDGRSLYVTEYECPGNSDLFHSEDEVRRLPR